MKMKNFDKSIYIPKTALEWLGIQILPKKDDRSFVYFIKSWIFYFNIIWCGPELFGEVFWLIEGIYKNKPLDKLCINAPCSFVCILAVVKLYCLHFNRDVVVNVVEKLRDLHPIDHDEELEDNIADNVIERKTIKDALKFLNMVIIFLWYSSVAVAIVFGTAPLISMGYDYYYSGSTEFKLPFLVKYIFEISTLSQWILVYAHQIWWMLTATLALIAVDIFFYALCAYLKMHFQLLCLQFENFVSLTSAVDTRINFSKAVRKHQELIKLVEQIELLYSKSTLCNIISSSLMICLCGFVVTFIRDVITLCCFFMFLSLDLIQISLLCFYGEMLNFSSFTVSQAVYHSLWYKADQNIKKCVLIVIIRAQKPCKLTAMKFVDLNLNALGAILRTSWSYFALLRTMYN